jgi:hypothetical protein
LGSSQVRVLVEVAVILEPEALAILLVQEMLDLQE